MKHTANNVILDLAAPGGQQILKNLPELIHILLGYCYNNTKYSLLCTSVLVMYWVEERRGVDSG